MRASSMIRCVSSFALAVVLLTRHADAARAQPRQAGGAAAARAAARSEPGLLSHRNGERAGTTRRQTRRVRAHVSRRERESTAKRDLARAQHAPPAVHHQSILQRHRPQVGRALLAFTSRRRSSRRRRLGGGGASGLVDEVPARHFRSRAAGTPIFSPDIIDCIHAARVQPRVAGDQWKNSTSASRARSMIDERAIRSARLFTDPRDCSQRRRPSLPRGARGHRGPCALRRRCPGCRVSRIHARRARRKPASARRYT